MTWRWRRSTGRRPEPQREVLDDHGRALALATQRFTESLDGADEAWLASHLASCPACPRTVDAYAADRALLRGLRERAPQPPRDLWARTAIALERERERAVRVRRASLPPRTPQRPLQGWPAASYERPARTHVLLSGLLVVALVVVSALANGLAPALFPVPSGSRGGGPAATPITVSADVGWIQPSTDGSYAIFLTRVDQVCPPTGAAACGPMTDVARGSINLGSRPQSVTYSPQASQLVVVSAGTSAGGAVLVVPVPTPSSSRPPGAPASPSGAPSGTQATSPATQPLESGAPAPSAASSPGVPGPSVQPTPSGAIAIAEGVIVVGGTAAYSPDGGWLAFAARPADGSTGPDVYAWRVGDAVARKVTADHRSIFSAWLGNQILGSRIDEVPLGSGAAGGPPPSGASNLPAPIAGVPASASPSATAAASVSSQAGTAPGAAPTTSTAPASAPAASSETAAASPAAAASSTSASAAPSSPGGASPAVSPEAAGHGPSSPEPRSSPISNASPRPADPAAGRSGEHGATAFLLDPATGRIRDLAGARYLRPVVDPTGRWVVYWEGTVVTDAAGLDWRPASGRLVVAPWSEPGAAAGSTPAASAPVAGSSARAGSGSDAPSTPVASTPAANATAPGSGGSSRPSAAPAATAVVGARGSAAPSGRTTGAGASSARPSLEAGGIQPLADGPVVDFDVQFDPSGTHLAIWTANPADPTAGYLSLFTLHEGVWRLEPDHRLVTVPALRGFSIGDGELAWVTPPDASGKGRIELIGWTADGFGSVESVPGDSLIVIR